MKTTTQLVALGDIIIPSHRQPDPAVVHQLANSIADVGLLHPILLTPERVLIAGRNRIAACVELGLTHIEARITTVGKLQQELAEIDENIIRRRLPVLERGTLLARRKEIYEALHPEARQHVRGGHAKAARGATERISPVPAFAADAASKLQTSERTVQEEIRIATALSGEAAEVVRGTWLEDERVRLSELTRLPQQEQGPVARMLVERRAKGVKAAVAELRRAEAGDAHQGAVPRADGPAERAWRALHHLRAAEEELAKGATVDALAQEVTEARSQLAAARAQIEVLLGMLGPNERRGRQRGTKLTHVAARPGTSSAETSSRWTPKHVWTLHRNPADLRGPVIAVRRRVLAYGRLLSFEMARRPAHVLMHSLEEHGCARTTGQLSDSGGFEASVWVYDHCPTADERKAWLDRRMIENAALASPSPDVWIRKAARILGEPDEAIRCKTTRSWRTSVRSTVTRSTFDVAMPSGDVAQIDLFELLTDGTASDFDDGSYTFYRDPPTLEELRRAGEERKQRAEQARLEGEARRRDQEQRARAYAEESRQRSIANGAGADALRRFGLTLPCTVEDVHRAFRKLIREKKVHPDQGGSNEAMREMAKLKELAVAYVETTDQAAVASRCA